MSVVANGTQTATIGTKHQLYTSNLGKTYALMVDTTNLDLGDVLELSIDVACEPGGSHLQAYFVTCAHKQADMAKISVPAIAPYGATFSLKQTAGTGREFKWCVAGV